MSVTCPYCSAPARNVSGHEVYPHRPDLGFLRFWQCRPCNAYVGCHKGTNRPLGTLADAKTRAARSQAHAVFDPIWLNSWDRRTARTKAYALLANDMGVSKDQCHIAMFNVEQCQRVIERAPTIANCLELDK